MRRRAFIAGLGGSIAAPLIGNAQQSGSVRRIAILMNDAADDPMGQERLATFQDSLKQLGWFAGGNVRLDTRWGRGDGNLYRKYAEELTALAPDVILAVGGTSVAALQTISRSIPIVFVVVSDPVNRGLVQSLAKPGGNATGFLQLEFSFGSKWLALLKQVAPSVARVAVVRDPRESSGVGQLAAIQTAASLFGVEIVAINPDNTSEMEAAFASFASASNGGFIAVQEITVRLVRGSLIQLAARYGLPAIYPQSYYVREGGLLSYGPDQLQQFRLAAGYVDRILKGEKPAELPVQAPTKFEMAINLGTAKALGLIVPPSLIAAADEVIE
jgi:putative tryptophan/tyrosine transport system substrate-binding protein